MADRQKRKIELKEYKRQLREQAADEREAKTGMRQTNGAMVAKIFFGALFIVYGFVPNNGEWSFSYFVTALLIGGALISWGLIPYINAKRKREHEEMKEILSIPLQTFHDAELQQAMDRIDGKTNSPSVAPQQSGSPEADELKKYKDMLDQGLISEKDYEKKKKKILGI